MLPETASPLHFEAAVIIGVGFGTFVVTDRAAGEARNPRTGEKVKVPASRTPKFRAGAGLKEAVNGR